MKLSVNSIWALANNAIDKVSSLVGDPFLLSVRLYWGWQFFSTGKGKLLNLDKTTEFFTSLNLPLPKLNAIMAGSTECFGGLLLLVGIFSRFISVPLMFTMIVAYLTADLKAVQGIFDDPDSFVSAAPFQFLFASLLIFVFGPGKLSLDALLFKQRPNL